MTVDTYKDGTVRVLPTITVNRVPGGYLVNLQDHASGQQCTSESGELSRVFSDLERVLAAGGEVFKPYKSYRVKNPLKRQKRNSG